ncbi:DUF2628 domain-containing protein [Desulfolutivibrio sulfoxidireducens]|uniref:DUF2628 domain-containing protein n=1 Tax=Desulfolutivibrio sulfoxidireducens TaxID=2773299 RepID=UPI00159E56DD|nr:DUF2628 domain-containing protein [Desulfolutivibrio sulfoxidireducens]QLA18509.1 DUF2628 domain-containing protein [Desulfolutivibrio sulfoxidireducens]
MRIVTDGEYRAFIGPEEHKYLPRFKRFDELAGNFKAGWHWPAFFFTFWWLLYRKLYLFAGVVFVASFVPYLNFAVMIASGLAGYHLYYRKARQDIERLKEAFPGKDVTEACAELGGVHRWVIWVGILVTILLLIAAFTLGFIGAMAND